MKNTYNKTLSKDFLACYISPPHQGCKLKNTCTFPRRDSSILFVLCLEHRSSNQTACYENLYTHGSLTREGGASGKWNDVSPDTFFCEINELVYPSYFHNTQIALRKALKER